MPTMTQAKHCPLCNADGRSPNPGTVWNLASKRMETCPQCDGQGKVAPSEGFPTPFWYEFASIVSTITGVAGPPASFTSPPAGGTLQIASEADFEWVFSAAQALDNFGNDATRWVLALLEDVSANFKFSSNPVPLASFAGSGQLPSPIIEPYRFGRKTQLALTLSVGLPPASTQVIGIGTGAALTFAFTLPGPVLPNSLTLTVSGGGVVCADNGNGAITNAGLTAAGTINYGSGALSVTYTGAPALNATITATYQIGPSRITTQFTFAAGYLMVGKQGVGSQQGPNA